ncbi:XrtA/PEP-CTERM system TPR-repeat protein PrsT [Rubrivivax rivuli]|uniref:XrtA/PEP-CTERM system TPR-repeat protein PrsT n=1 Tax=Rubrivivax rivuli TaxID=1862385 RepID=UPI0013E37920|nr:XrtA/PEP-CTERM system TPR-repeat protein PrsT [Rubrivivax rivuli]
MGAASVCLLLLACSGPTDKELIASAKASMEKKDTRTAVIQLKNALASNPQSGEVRLLLGRALLAQGDAASALLELRKAQELQVPDEQVVPDLARAMLLTGEQTRLIAQYGTFELRDASAGADLKTSLASAYAIQGDAIQANTAAEDALRLKPGFAPALIVQARLRAQDGSADEAIALLDKVLAADPSDVRAATLKADFLLYGKRDPEAALAAFRLALKAQPDSVISRAGVINILLGQQKTADARTEFQQLKSTAAGHPETLYYEAQFAFIDKDYPRALTTIEQVLKGFPNNVRALELAGATEFQLRNYLAAEAHLGKALKLVPQQRLSRLLLAQTYLRTGDPQKTLDTLKPVLDAGLADGSALALAGEAHLQLGDAKASEQAFQAAVKAAPADVRVRTSAAMAQLARGNDSSAILELEAVAAGDSGPRADLALISARLRQNDVAGALKTIDGLEKKMPDQALPHQLRGRVLTLKNDLPGAAKSFETAIAKEPSYFPPVASLAALDLAANKPEKARERFAAFIQAHPKSWQAHMAVAELEARVGAPAAKITEALRAAVKANAGEARPHVALVNDLINQGDGKAALLAAQDATAALPNNTEVMDALGRAELAAGDTQRALTTFKKLASLQPRNALPEMRLAEVHMAAKDNESAARSLRRAAELAPGNQAIPLAQARLAMMGGKPDEAVKVARDLQKRLPQDPVGLTLEGDVEASRKNWDAAANAYRGVLKLARSSEVTAKLHTVLVSANKGAEAERLAADWLKANPKDTSFNYFLGDVALAQGDLPRAEARYRAVLQVEPENALALNNVAWLMVKQGKPGGLALAQQANKLLPDRAPIIDTLSYALEADNKISEAIDAQKRAIALAPKDGNLALRLAKLYIKAGDKTRARAELDSLSRLGDKFSGHAEVSALLKTL